MLLKEFVSLNLFLVVSYIRWKEKKVFFVGGEERRKNIFLLYLSNSALRKLAACLLLGQQFIMSGTLKTFALRIFWIFYIALNLKCLVCWNYSARWIRTWYEVNLWFCAHSSAEEVPNSSPEMQMPGKKKIIFF